MLRLSVLAAFVTVGFASDSWFASDGDFMAPGHERFLDAEDAIAGQTDQIDNLVEEKSAPHTLPGWIYTALTPIFGVMLVIFSFPLIWFNEQRANGALEKMYGAVPTDDGTASGKAKATEFSGEKKFLTKEHEAERKFFPCCNWVCCSAVEKCCAKMPKGTSCDFKAWAGRFLGLLMMLFGVQLAVAPMFWFLNMFWLLAWVFGGHLALCIIKWTCCAWCCTSCTSNISHNPWAILGIFVFTAGTFAAWIWWKSRGQQRYYHLL